MSTPHKWQPITDIAGDPNELTDGELKSLLRVWQKQKEQLADSEGLRVFEERFNREWAIETGIIENVYSLDRGITQTLIKRGIDAAYIPHGASQQDSVLVAQIIQDHYDSLEGMFEFITNRRQLSTSYIKELHASLLRNVEYFSAVDQFGTVFQKMLEKGVYKLAPNSPKKPDGFIHEYCPPEHTAAEMDAFIVMHHDHETKGIPPEVSAAWAHHRYTQIHPFSDGNGRVARALASLVFIKAGWFPLIVKDEEKTRYLDALETADGGDLRPLVQLFVDAQREAFLQASEIVYQVTPITSTSEAVLAIRDKLIQQRQLPQVEWMAVKTIADRLLIQADEQFAKLSAEMRKEISSLRREFSFKEERFVISAHGTNKLHEQIRERATQIANQPGDWVAYNAAINLNLRTNTNSMIGIAFHATGPEFHGLIGIVPYFAKPDDEVVLIPCSRFQTNYEEDLDSALRRFAVWLDKVLLDGLNLWRQSL